MRQSIQSSRFLLHEVALPQRMAAKSWNNCCLIEYCATFLVAGMGRCAKTWPYGNIGSLWMEMACIGQRFFGSLRSFNNILAPQSSASDTPTRYENAEGEWDNRVFDVLYESRRE